MKGKVRSQLSFTPLETNGTQCDRAEQCDTGRLRNSGSASAGIVEKVLNFRTAQSFIVNLEFIDESVVIEDAAVCGKAL